MKDIITSSDNTIIKHVRALSQKNSRDKFEQFFVEGYRIVKDAFDNGCTFKYLLVSDNIADNIKEFLNEIENIPLYTIKDSLFKQISDTDTPQGILAVLNKKEYNLENILDSNENFLVLLENIQDPGNMGTIIRTADAAGVRGVIVSKGCVDIYNPKVLRSTMGSIFHLSIIKVDDFDGYIDKLKQNEYNLFGAHLKGITNYFEVDMKGKVGIIIGNEANGITDDIAQKCKLIKIPMFGSTESLNASVSAGVIMYEYVRQKLSK